MKIEVHPQGGTRRVIEIEAGATKGATVGVNIWNQDGSLFVPTAVPPETGGAPITYWRLILEIPPNVVALAETATTGLYVITGAGTSETRSIQAAPGETTVSNGDGVAGNPTIGLADVADAGGGALQKTAFDAKGRKTGTSAATTDDLTEGSNLYFTDARAQDAAGAVLDDTGDVELHYETSPARRIWAALSGAVQSALSAAVSALQPGDNVSELTNDAAYTPNALPLAGGTMSGPIVIPNNSVAFESGSGAAVLTGALGNTWIARAAAPGTNAFATQRSDGSLGLTVGDTTMSWAGEDLSVTRDTIGNSSISLSAPAGSIRDFAWQTEGVNRWVFRCTNAAEGGSNTGSNFRLGARADDGTALINVLDINRNEGHLLPGTDNSQNIGASSRRWAVIYAATGTINTSDERLKSNIRELSETELACASDLAALPKIYQFNDALAEKGHAARLHCSPTVQSVIAVMQAHGLDPFRYGFVCHDEWEERPESVDSETGEVVDEYRPAGDRYSLRPDELHFFIARGQEERLRRLEQLVGL